VLKKFGASVGSGAVKAMSHTVLPQLK